MGRALASAAATPMTYLHEGHQFVVLAVGSGESVELLALALPKSP